MATKFGKELRKLRIDHDDNIAGMANKLGVSISYVSGVEAGGKNIPTDWVKKLKEAYGLTAAEVSVLENAFDECAKSINVDLLAITAKQRKVSSMFFRKVPNMSDSECEAIIESMTGKERK